MYKSTSRSQQRGGKIGGRTGAAAICRYAVEAILERTGKMDPAREKEAMLGVEERRAKRLAKQAAKRPFTKPINCR